MQHQHQEGKNGRVASTYSWITYRKIPNLKYIK